MDEVDVNQAEAVGKAEWLGHLLEGAEEHDDGYWWHHEFEVWLEVDDKLPAGEIYLCREPMFDPLNEEPGRLVFRVFDWSASEPPDVVAVYTYLETERLERRVLWASPGYIPF